MAGEETPRKEAGFRSGAWVNGVGVRLDRWAQGGEAVIQHPVMPVSLARGLGRSEPGSSTQAIMGHQLAETEPAPEWHGLLVLAEVVQ